MLSTNNSLVQKLIFDDYQYITDLNTRIVKCSIDSIEQSFYKLLNKNNHGKNKKDINRYHLLISDTHDDSNYVHNLIHAANKSGIKNLLHCGDITDPGTLHKFREFNGRVSGVLGNHDKKNFIQLKMVAEKHGFRFRFDIQRLGVMGGKKKVVIVHGDDINLLNRVLDHEKFNIMVYGHYHRRILLWNSKQNKFVINPGAYFDDPLPSDPDENNASFVLFPIDASGPNDIVFFIVKTNSSNNNRRY